MSVKQFNGSYSPHDDRILFRFNTTEQTEYIFWLTRRITHFILASAGQVIKHEYEKQAPTVENVISEVQQPEKQATNFTKPYEPAVQHPLGGDAVLVLDAKCQLIKTEGQDIFSLDFIMPGGGNINLKLPMPVTRALVLLLEELNLQAKWGLPG